MANYSYLYSKSSFWDKISSALVNAGKEVIKTALILYYALVDPDTPDWAKSVIIGALGYFISPFDAIPDFTPVVGFTDDLGVLLGALSTVAFHIKKKHKKAAKEKLEEMFE